MKYLVIYFIIINFFAFMLYGADKRKAKKNKWRVPESTLLFVALIGGGIGAYAGMKVWHHKTQKIKFRLLVPLFIIIWLAGGIYIAMGHPGIGENNTAPAETADADFCDTESADAKMEPVVTTDEITLAFAGDINFDDSWCNMVIYYERGEKLSNVIDEEYLELMRDADIFWVNNEFTYSDGGSPLDGKMYTFRAKPENVNLLKEMGADIVGLANNHVYDYGKEALLDTFDTLENAGILYVGAGENLDEAMSPVYIEKEGITIAYVAASRAEKYKMTPQATEEEPGILRCYDNTLFLEAIEEADENADYVIALPHWGTEYQAELEDAQINGAKEYIEAGADAVIGAHTHCLQGIGEYNGKPIVYSLGNFWFNEKTLETMLYEIHITIEKTTDEKGDSTSKIIDVETEIIPGMQEDYTTTPAKTEDEKEELLNYIYSLPTE